MKSEGLRIELKMKNCVLLFIAFIMVSVAEAQIKRPTDDPLDKVVLAINLDGVAMSNLEMQKELNLSPEQLVKVQALNSKRFEQIRLAEQELQDNSIQLSKAIYSINLEIDRELSLMLQPEQMRAFLELDSRQNARYASDKEE